MDARKIPTKAVTSSNISRIGYDEPTKTCVVEFIRGGKYKIEGMTQRQFDEFSGASSLGSYYNSEIKHNGVYSISKM
jgi:hypothetical protein